MVVATVPPMAVAIILLTWAAWMALVLWAVTRIDYRIDDRHLRVV